MKQDGLKHSLSNIVRPMSPSLSQALASKNGINSDEISPQAIYDAMQPDSNLIDLKAKEKYNFFFYGKEEEEEKKENLIPVLEEDV